MPFSQRLNALKRRHVLYDVNGLNFINAIVLIMKLAYVALDYAWAA